MKKIVYLFFIFLFACGETQWEEVKINDQYLILLPDYLEKTSRIKPEASLQYENNRKQTFIIVMDERKSSLDKIKSLQDYFKLVAEEYCLLDKQLKKLEVDEKKIQGANAIYYEYTMHPKEVPTRFIGAIIEGKEYFYHVVAWTKESGFENYGDDLRKAVVSLREI